jgi:exonuclease SbcD
MRILHTADWHLNDRLGRIDRTDDLRRAVERIADICRSERIDTLLVAGDLFSELARPDALRDTIRHWQDTFAPFLRNNGTIVTLTGNHDNESFCRTLQHAMTLATPPTPSSGSCLPTGRLYLAAEPMTLSLGCRKYQSKVTFVLMPYPTPGRYLHADAKQRYTSLDEKNRLLVQEFSRVLDQVNLEPNSPAILAAHVNLHGSTVGTHSLFRMTEQEDVIIDGKDFHQRYCYVALGHIHKPQSVGYPNVRYSGSLEALDLGEKNDPKSVVILEIGPDGCLAPPQVCPIPSTRIYDLTLRNPTNELPDWRDRYAAATQDLVHLHVHYTAGEHNLEQILKELDEIFPRWYSRDWTESRALSPGTIASEVTTSQSFAETVRDYVAQELVQHDDAERQELLRIVDELMVGEG